MRILFGRTVVTAAGTRVQLSTLAEKVKSIQFKTELGNTGRMFIGLADVSLTVNGWEFEIPTANREVARTPPIDFGEGSVLLNVFYADATVNGEAINWWAILR